jgi:GNAT superfamily N-acetyltransferase
MAAVAPAAIRTGHRAEADAIRHVIRAANAQFAAVAPPDIFASYLVSALDVEGRTAQGATVLVAERSGTVVGTVTHFLDANDEGMPVRLPRGTAGLRATAVHPEAQGHGIGMALVEACVERARDHGAERIALHTAPFMTAAVALYERSGFRRVPAFDFPMSAFFAGDPGTGLVAIAYVRDLR